MNHYKTLLSDINKKISEKENELTFYENDLKKYTDVASELSPRIETKRGAKAIEVEVQKIELQIKLTEKKYFKGICRLIFVLNLLFYFLVMEVKRK